MSEARIIVGDCRKVLATLPDGSVDCVVTSPPYFALRNYSLDEEGIGLEDTWDEHLNNIIDVFRGVWRVLSDTGLCFVNYGDAYDHGFSGKRSNAEVDTAKGQFSSHRANQGLHSTLNLGPKQLMMMPARIALALQADGWILRSEIVWHKPNPMPESVRDRPTAAHEKVFMFAKQPRGYFYDADAVRTGLSEGTVERFGEDGSPNFRNGTFGFDEKNLPHNFSGKTVPTGWASSERYKGQDARYGVRENPTYKKQDGHGPRHAGFNERYAEKEKVQGAALRNVWRIPTFPYSEAHFATYPPALVEPCIRAGSSERGVCAKCRAPYVRVVETPKVPDNIRNRGEDTKLSYHTRQVGSGQKLQDWREENPPVTKGWKQTCECKDSEPTPSTVLDPFAGSGTTGVVALRENRNTILIEANPDYAQMAYERVSEEVRPMFDTLELVQ